MMLYSKHKEALTHNQTRQLPKVVGRAISHKILSDAKPYREVQKNIQGKWILHTQDHVFRIDRKSSTKLELVFIDDEIAPILHTRHVLKSQRY